MNKNVSLFCCDGKFLCRWLYDDDNDNDDTDTDDGDVELFIH